MVRVRWNEFETAKLIGTYWKIQLNPATKHDELQALSALLRNYVFTRGISIDEKYRNVNGMELQLAYLEYIITDGKRGLIGGSQIYKDMVYNYNHARIDFDRILSEANALMGMEELDAHDNHLERGGISLAAAGKLRKQHFYEWLSSKVSPRQLSELYKAASDIDEFYQSGNVLRAPLFETTDIKTLKRIRNDISSNKLFMIKYHVNSASALIRYYLSFLESADNTKSNAVLTNSADEIILTTIESSDHNLSVY